jgi:hypothetical protein
MRRADDRGARGRVRPGAGAVGRPFRRFVTAGVPADVGERWSAAPYPGGSIMSLEIIDRQVLAVTMRRGTAGHASWALLQPHGQDRLRELQPRHDLEAGRAPGQRR